jgi:hypothetical protein
MDPGLRRGDENTNAIRIYFDNLLIAASARFANSAPDFAGSDARTALHDSIALAESPLASCSCAVIAVNEMSSDPPLASLISSS